MAFLKKLKLAIGFSPEEDEALADDPETTSSLSSSAKVLENTYQPQSHTPLQVELKEDDATNAIFEHVVDTFNKSLPDFLKQSVNAEAQRKYLYDTLSNDLKNYLSNIAARTQQQCKESWDADKQRLQENVRELEDKARSIEEKREELSQKQLSVERQKRALSDRVNDLEKQLMTYEAEREQFQLENKSLVNKLKVANVNEKDIDAMREEINRLQEELNKARQAALDGNSSDIAAQSNEDHSAKISELTDKITSLEAQLNSANESKANAIKEAERSNSELEQANQEIELLRSKVNDADAFNQEISEIQKQIEQFEKVKAKKDERISSLSKELEAANQDVVNLKKTIADNLEYHANSDLQRQEEIAKLNEEIAKLNEETAKLQQELSEAKEATATEPKQAERRSKSTSASRGRLDSSNPMDDILSDTDWLVSPSSLKSNKNGSNNHTNHRREENDAQMSLF